MSFARYSVETTLIRVFLVGVGLVAGIINARWLGAEGVGILALLLLISVFAFRFGNLGFGSAFTFFVASNRARARVIVPLALWTGLAASMATTAVVLAVWQRPFSPWNDIQPGLVYLYLPMVPLVFVRTYLQRVMSGELRIREMNIAALISGAGYTAFLVGLVIMLELGLLGAILSALIADSLGLLFLLWRSVRRPDATAETDDAEHPDRPPFSELWRYGRWNYLLMLSNFLVEELPLLLLKTFTADNTPVGLMSRAQGLTRQQRVVILPIAEVLFPFTAASREDEAIRRTNVLCRNSLVLVGFFVGGLALFIRPILLVLYGESFLPATEIFYALAPGAVLWPVGHFLAIHIAASGHPKAAFLASFATVAAAAGLCALLIPPYGGVGAGLSASAVYALRAFSLLLVYTRLTGAPWREVLVPLRTDWAYYRRLLGLLPVDRFQRKRRG